MVVKIVTDSCSDITQDDARRLGITVIPVYVRFGNEVFRDGIDLSIDEFYRRQETGTIHASTATPAPGDFARIYEDLAKETDEIISIHVSKKHSATIDSALLGKEKVQSKKCRIEVLDSCGLTMWQGLVAMEAAQAAQAGEGMDQVLSKAINTIKRLRGLGLLDTLRHAIRGGRLSNTIFRVESLLNVKALVTLRDGEIKPTGLVRTWETGILRLREFLENKPDIEKIAIIYGTIPDDAQKLLNHVRVLYPGIESLLARIGPAIGSHAGPKTILVVTA